MTTIPSTWRVPLVIVLAGGLVLSLNMGVRQTFGLFIEPMSLDLGISISNISLSIAVQNLLWGVLTPLFGGLADRYGAGRCLAFGALCYAAGILLMAMGGGPALFHTGCGFLVGVAVAATGYPLVLAVVARAAPDHRRSLYIALAATGGSVGQFILLPISQVLIQSFGWVEALITLAAACLLILLVAPVLKGKPETPAGQAAQSLSEAVGEASRHPGFWLLTGGFFVCGFHVSFIATHLPGYIVSCNLDPLVGASALGVIGFFNIIGGILAGVLGSRLRKKYLLSGIYLARAVVIGLFFIGPKTELTVMLFSASFGLLWLSTVPVTSALVSDIFGTRYLATLFAIVMMAHQVGAFFGAWFGGLSYDMTGSYDGVWLMAVALGLLAAVLNWPINDEPVRASKAATA